jgi:hypothetical protein
MSDTKDTDNNDDKKYKRDKKDYIKHLICPNCTSYFINCIKNNNDNDNDNDNEISCNICRMKHKISCVNEYACSFCNQISTISGTNMNSVDKVDAYNMMIQYWYHCNKCMKYIHINSMNEKIKYQAEALLGENITKLV